MVRFIRYWIEQGMESPEAREEKARLHMEKVRHPDPLIHPRSHCNRGRRL